MCVCVFVTASAGVAFKQQLGCMSTISAASVNDLLPIRTHFSVCNNKDVSTLLHNIQGVTDHRFAVRGLLPCTVITAPRWGPATMQSNNWLPVQLEYLMVRPYSAFVCWQYIYKSVSGHQCTDVQAFYYMHIYIRIYTQWHIQITEVPNNERIYTPVSITSSLRLHFLYLIYRRK